MDLYNNITKVFKDLIKNDQGLTDQLKATYETDLTKDIQHYPKHIYKDTLVPEMGNVFSFNSFLKQNQNCGIFVIIDANDFNSINVNSGYAAGNDAIKTLMGCIVQTASATNCKAFRLAGAQVLVHAPNMDKVAVFVDNLKKAVMALPMVDGKHKMSVCVGLGYSPEHAEMALKIAKQKLSNIDNGIERRVNLPGQEETVVHSLLGESANADWRPLLGYSEDAPHEEMKTVLPKEVKSPLKPSR
jgi:GGDEF domain-containing protein